MRKWVIGRVFHALGLIEHWGSGIQRMTAACADAGLPPPVLEEIGTHFRVTCLPYVSDWTMSAAKPHTLRAGGASPDETAAAIDKDARDRWSAWANPEWISFAARAFYDASPGVGERGR